MYEGAVIDMLWHAGRHATTLNDRIEVVFARHDDYSLGKIKQHFQEFQDCNPRLKSVSVDDPSASCPLQVADVIAYETRSHHRQELNLEPKRSRYPMDRLRDATHGGYGAFQELEWRMAPPTYSRNFLLKNPLPED